MTHNHNTLSNEEAAVLLYRLQFSADTLTLQQIEALRMGAEALRALTWRPIETAPKDGAEFVAAYARQGFVKQLVSWNIVHSYWQSKGEWIPGFSSNATHWMPLPAAPQPQGESNER